MCAPGPGDILYINTGPAGSEDEFSAFAFKSERSLQTARRVAADGPSYRWLPAPNRTGVCVYFPTMGVFCSSSFFRPVFEKLLVDPGPW